MTAQEVVDAYVTEVAGLLPRKQRNDVAFELRALLGEELQGRAEDAGRAADEGLALELVRGFGRPEEVAARYRPTLTVIDPQDGHSFVRATWVGLVLIWVVGLVEALRQPFGSGLDVLHPLSRWWNGAVVPSLWWPGVLVVWFGLASWSRRRRPQGAQEAPWVPRQVRPAGGEHLGRRTSLALVLLAQVGVVLGVWLLFNPRVVLDFFWGGRAAPAAYAALTYTESFLSGPAPWLGGLLLLYVPLWFVLLVQGRWSPALRRVETGLQLVLCGVMVWALLAGPAFAVEATDRWFKLALGVTVVAVLVHLVWQWRRAVRPAPSLPGVGDRRTP